MGIILALKGRSARKGLLRQAPSRESLTLSISNWLKTKAAPKPVWLYEHERGLEVDLYALEEAAHFEMQGGGLIRFSAHTNAAGAGYHAWLCELLRAMGTDLEITWSEDRDDFDETGYFASSSKAELQEAMRAWLGGLAKVSLERIVDGMGNFTLALPIETRFRTPGPILTPLGPRDHYWLEHLQSFPAGADFWPWAEFGTGPDYALGTALGLMWTQVRWREPMLETEEALLANVDALLTQAHQGGKQDSIPYREWQELRGYAAISNELDTEIAALAALAKGDLLGYRRDPVVVSQNGWSVSVPGNFGERWQENIYELLGTEGYLGFTFLNADRELPLPPALPGEPYSNPSLELRTSLSYRQDPNASGAWFLVGMIGKGTRAAQLTIGSADRTWIEETLAGIDLTSDYKYERADV